MSKKSERSEGRIKRQRESMQAGVSHHTIIHLIHTHTHLDLDCMICFSIDPLFDFTKYEMQICLVLLSYLELQKNFILSKKRKKTEIALY